MKNLIRTILLMLPTSLLMGQSYLVLGGGVAYPYGAGAALSYTPSAINCYTNVTGAILPCNFAAGAPTVISGATADYFFKDGSGTSLADSSGNANTGTLGASALAPTWVSNGLAFSGLQNVQLPAALNGTMTFELVVYINPVTSGPAVFNPYPVLISSSMGGSGFNLMYEKNTSSNVYSLLTYAPSLYVGNAPATASSLLFSGFHVITVACGATDHIYVDGVESPYFRQGTCSGFQTTGNLYLGSSGVSPWNASGFSGTYYRLRMFSTQLTPAQAIQDSFALRAEVGGRGVTTAPLPLLQNIPVLHIAGDSIACGWNGASCNLPNAWPALVTLTNQPAYNVTNWGIPGVFALSLVGSEANRVAPLCQTSTGPAVAIFMAGTNDLASLIPSTPQTVLASQAAEVRTLKAGGCQVFLGTMISRTGNDNGGSITNDADKNALDALILSQWRAIGADGVIDFAADPLVGADGANTNTTYFLADKVHPTLGPGATTGQGRMGIAASNALNYSFSTYSIANPHVVATNTYTLTSADVAVTAAPTAAAAYTMPDCTGPSGAVYTISNTQSAFALTVIGGTSQPINGLATAITIASNSVALLQDIANPKSASGCHWTLK